VFKRILIAKMHWGKFYQGEDLEQRFPDPQGVGEDYERFNFRRTPATSDGRFYGSIPRNAPMEDGEWLVVFIAHDQDGRYLPVGWYVDATFEPEDRERPEYVYDRPMPRKDETFKYRLSADSAYVIPPALRQHFVVPAVVNEKMKHATYVFARKPSLKDDEPWREELARFAEQVASGQFSNQPSTFNPISMPGEPLSDTVLRERW
jgi:hypothetical protein